MVMHVSLTALLRIIGQQTHPLSASLVAPDSSPGFQIGIEAHPGLSRSPYYNESYVRRHPSPKDPIPPSSFHMLDLPNPFFHTLLRLHLSGQLSTTDH